MIFRADDVSPNTDIAELQKMYRMTQELFPGSEFWSVASIIARFSSEGSVYPEAPFKDRPLAWFYDVDECRLYRNLPGTTVSHGLLHADHSAMAMEAQELSIMTSCRLLNTNIFVPPFNRFDLRTEIVCGRNGIKLIDVADGWRCLDREEFDPSHEKWYFHPWRFKPEEFRRKLNAQIKEKV